MNYIVAYWTDIFTCFTFIIKRDFTIYRLFHFYLFTFIFI